MHSLQRAQEREKLDRARAEQDILYSREQRETALKTLQHLRDRGRERAGDREGGERTQFVNEVETDSAVQGHLSAMQRAVAQLEVEQNLLQKKNNHLEKKIERLRSELQHLRETLTLVCARLTKGPYIMMSV
ncbi:hypothetical protein cypCar_00002084 [Cyprinus carpio]|nr:hypothetical protein cypCar_00002084 [Cyprinus carpio]